ncbi:fibronectin type III domain-containing protein [Bacteroides thetaiotaomicron]|uniref:fibronectin type III domain-containing protein n=1 Tax=Bacteroides thetaiotaomicron TaxID=818 RepID=UPI00216682D2|nr:fibronectin type III domain-containing protein [Bacteroides thetaiotaomicron]MCS2714017.1 fibronectin type III domain-containing protein [Bacteroides thetaiotaomicron]MCS2874236.1 fibronectin type III domain-containing protein [Bacteroides thetaiotaomicron]
MNLLKLMTVGCLLSCFSGLMTSCSDDDDAGSKVLLRPVTAMEIVQNKAYLSWKSVEGATEYIVEVYKVVDKGEELYKTETVPGDRSSCVIDLDWEENYKFKVKCEGNGRLSGYWETEVTGILYRPLSIELGEARTIDTQALISWTPNDTVVITALTAVPMGLETVNSQDIKVYNVSSEEYLAGSKIIDDLTPETSYRVSLYSGDEQSSDTYQARIEVKTAVTENLDEDYGTANRIDLRNEAFDPDYFNKLDWNSLAEGTTFVLPAGKTYVLNSGETVIEFAHSVHFVTPQTLEDYPTFSFDNAFRIVEGGVVDKVTFKRINLRASKSLSEVADNSLSGKQVICPESDVFLINTIDFTNCYIENFRSIVRSKKATGNVGAIAFKECTINAIGNQGIVSTDGKNGNYINDVSFDECTITNICGIADLRNSSSGKSISITNTTFCYAPMENSFLFRVDPSIAVKIENCVFGGSMKIDGKLPKFNELGSGGQDDYTGVYPFSSVNSFQANDRTSSKGSLGLSDSKMSTATLFTAPGTNNFKLNELFTGCSSVGASKWRR